MEIHIDEYENDCYIHGKDVEILSEKLLKLGGVLIETEEKGSFGCFIPKDNYMSVLYLSYTGDLPPYPPKKDISLKIKLRTKNHLLVKGTKTEVIKITNNIISGSRKEIKKYENELKQLGGHIRTLQEYTILDEDIPRFVYFFFTGKILTGQILNYKILNVKKTIEDIKKFENFFETENKLNYENLFISFPVVVQEYFLFFSAKILLQKIKCEMKCFCRAVKLFNLFLNDDDMKTRKIFENYSNNFQIRSMIASNSDMCNKYEKEQKVLKTMFLGTNLKPKGGIESSWYNFSNNNYFDRNLLPLINNFYNEGNYEIKKEFDDNEQIENPRDLFFRLQAQLFP